jgi:hypothetical protein
MKVLIAATAVALFALPAVAEAASVMAAVAHGVAAVGG